jgi:hypothetical protein
MVSPSQLVQHSGYQLGEERQMDPTRTASNQPNRAGGSSRRPQHFWPEAGTQVGVAPMRPTGHKTPWGKVSAEARVEAAHREGDPGPQPQ